MRPRKCSTALCPWNREEVGLPVPDVDHTAIVSKLQELVLIKL